MIVACDHANECGGCPAIALDYDAQLAQKRARVVRSLARYRSLELVYAEPVVAADPITEYRARAKLVVGAGGAIGLYAKGGGHDVVDVPRCRVLTPLVARVVSAVRDALRARSDVDVRAIDVREANGGAPRVLLTLVVERSKQSDALRELASSLVRQIPELVGVAASLHDGTSPQVLGNETVLLAGENEADDRVGRALQIATFGSFVQAHRAQAARVHAIVAASVRATERARVLDLYAGSGAIALALASSGADVTCVEAFGPAASRIARAAEREGAKVTAIHADAASAVTQLQERGERFDAIVVNPPRRGVEPAAREAVARLDAPTIAYVSCDPDTLARDLDHFARLGYRCVGAHPLDMIPLTEEVETVAILRRATPIAPRVLWEDETALFVEKNAHESTAESDAGGLGARVRALDGAQGATCVQRLDRGTSGVAIYARSPRHADAWRAALGTESARRVFLAATRGIVSSKGALRARDSMQNARIKFRRIAIFAKHSVARITPEAALEPGERARERTDVIRRELAAIDHPVLGDERFGHAPTNRHFEEKYALDRTFLHCVRIEVDHPVTRERLVVESPLPGDLATVLVRASGEDTLALLDQKNALGTSSIPPPPSAPLSKK